MRRLIALVILLCPGLASPPGAGPSPEAKNGRGFIEVAPSQRYFQFEDGTAFFPIGQNDWPPRFDRRKQSDKEIEAYFRDMREHGVNVLRILVDTGDRDGAVWVENPPGTFNPEFKAWMDMMVSLAEKHDVYLIVAFFPNLVGTVFGNWRFYPYNKAAGGVVDRVSEMVTSPVAREAQKRRMRYFVDNWGKSPNIFSWELFNEFWLPPEKGAKKDAIRAHNRWIDEMGAYLKAYETGKLGRHHLRSVSTMRSEFPRANTGLKPGDTNIYSSPNLDFASFHAYGQTLLQATNSSGDFGILKGNRIEPGRLVRAVQGTMNRMLERAPSRPVFCSEDFQIANPRAPGYGIPLNPVRKMVEDYSDAERFDLFHAANLAYVMSGAAGSTMRFPSGYFEDEMYDRLLALSRFAAKVPWPTFRARPASDRVATDRSDLIRMAMADDTWMIGWLYQDVPFAKRRPITPEVTLKGLAAGKAEVVWIETNTARELRTDPVGSDPFRVTPPPFEGHIAWIVRPAD